MSLEFAILGFLNQQPLSGYDLKKNFDLSVSHFWPATQSQIYRSLNTILEAGWASVDVVDQDGKPNRKVYSITPAGQVALAAWLRAPQPPPDLRFAPLIQVFFGAGLTDDELLVLLVHWEQAAAVRLQRMEALDAARPQDDTREARLQGLTLDYGRRLAQAGRDWAREARAVLLEEGKK